MLKKLFGGSDKPKTVAAPPKKDPEKVKADLEAQCDMLGKRIKVVNAKVADQKTKALAAKKAGKN